MEIIPGPDFPTGGIICGRQGILDGYTHRPRQGHSSGPRRHRRGRKPQPDHHHARCRTSRRAIASPRRSASWSRTSASRASPRCRDESSARNGEPVRLVVDLKRDADPQLVLNQLYQFSPLQKTVSIIMLALVDGRPRTLHAQADAGGVPAPPRAGDPPAHRVPAPRGQAARPRPRRAAHRHLVAGRGDPHLPQFAEPGRGQGAAARDGGGGRRAGAGAGRRRTSPRCSARLGALDELPHDRGAGRGGRAHAARPARRPGTRRDPQGVQRPARARSVGYEELLSSEANILAVIRRRPGRAARQVRRRPQDRDHRRRAARSTSRT